MYVLVTLLLLAACDPSTSNGIYNREHDRLQTDFRGGEFFQNIRDWFYNLKNEIHERLYGQTTITTPAFLPTDILNLDKFELQKRFRNREWHLLDLSSLSFDPNQDWGFRVGDWYFIQKGFKDEDEFENNSDQSDFQFPSTMQVTDSVEVETEETFDITNDSGVTESSSTTSIMTVSTNHNVTPVMTQQTDSQTTIQTTELINSSENLSSTTHGPRLRDNETDNDSDRRGSTEVLIG